jgi:hypothetical protein
MLTYSTILIISNGLFDFDLTLLIQGILFLTLSFAISFFFLNPLSIQLEKRNFFINYINYKAQFFFNFAYNKLLESLSILIEENLLITKYFISLNKDINIRLSQEINHIKLQNNQKLKEIRSKYISETGLLLYFLIPKIDQISEIVFKEELKKNNN